MTAAWGLLWRGRASAGVPGANTSILFGAVLAAEGGPVHAGAHCVIMEQAVIRGTPKHPARLGEAVLVGPHAHLSGCTVEDEVFLATGAVVFNALSGD